MVTITSEMLARFYAHMYIFCTVEPVYSGHPWARNNREVVALKRCLMYGVCQLGLELTGCNKEVAALHSDHYIQV